jgi:alpha-tubulin suppressor-like RCC1 family protein
MLMTDNGQTIALLASGQLWERGSGRFGQLGDGSSGTLSTRPVRDPVDVAQLSSTANGVVALGRHAGPTPL